MVKARRMFAQFFGKCFECQVECVVKNRRISAKVWEFTIVPMLLCPFSGNV